MNRIIEIDATTEREAEARLNEEKLPRLGWRIGAVGGLVFATVAAVIFKAPLLALPLVVLSGAFALNLLNALFKAVAFGTGTIASFDGGESDPAWAYKPLKPRSVIPHRTMPAHPL